MKSSWLILLALLLAASTLAACGRNQDAPPSLAGEPAVTVAPDARSTPKPAAPATPTPTATLTPTPTPPQPPIPTPEVDLTDRSLYAANLKPAFAGDVDLVPHAPHYFIRAELLPGPTPLVRGVERVRYVNQEATPLDAIYFRLYPNLPGYGGASQAGPVIVDNRFVSPTLEYADSALRVSLAAPLPPGAAADITLWFTATLPTNVTPGTAGSGLYGFFGGVYDLAGFYPTIPVYDDEGWNLEVAATFGDATFTDIAFHQVEFTLPGALQIVASGSVLEERPNPDGTTTWRLAAGPMRAFYLAASEHYRAISQEVNGATVNSWHLPGGEEGARTALAYATSSLATFEQLFGPYPYRELDVAAMPTTAFGMEYPGVIDIAQSFYGPNGGAFAISVVHEVAHQWWYNLVGNDQPDEPWLDEALCNYAVYLHYEAVNWPEMRDAMMNNIFWYRYNAARNLGIDRPVGGPVTGFDPANYINMVYSKGPLFLHAVRERMGDQAFFAALADYAATHRYGVAYPEDLLAAFRRHTTAPLDDLYTEWITGAP